MRYNRDYDLAPSCYNMGTKINLAVLVPVNLIHHCSIYCEYVSIIDITVVAIEVFRKKIEQFIS